ncbi:unnamed protein product, partial [Amoebophrya sp. A120]
PVDANEFASQQRSGTTVDVARTTRGDFGSVVQDPYESVQRQSRDGPASGQS